MIKFKRKTDSDLDQGWLLDSRFLERVQEALSRIAPNLNLEIEEIESVLLATELASPQDPQK